MFTEIFPVSFNPETKLSKIIEELTELYERNKDLRIVAGKIRIELSSNKKEELDEFFTNQI